MSSKHGALKEEPNVLGRSILLNVWNLGHVLFDVSRHSRVYVARPLSLGSMRYAPTR